MNEVMKEKKYVKSIFGFSGFKLNIKYLQLRIF